MVNGLFVDIPRDWAEQPTMGPVSLVNAQFYDPLHGSLISDPNSLEYLSGKGWFKKAKKFLTKAADGVKKVHDKAIGLIPDSTARKFFQTVSPITQIGDSVEMVRAIGEDFKRISRGEMPNRSYNVQKTRAIGMSNLIDEVTNKVVAVVPNSVAQDYLKQISPLTDYNEKFKKALAIETDLRSGKVPQSVIEGAMLKTNAGARYGAFRDRALGGITNEGHKRLASGVMTEAEKRFKRKYNIPISENLPGLQKGEVYRGDKQLGGKGLAGGLGYVPQQGRGFRGRGLRGGAGYTPEYNTRTY